MQLTENQRLKIIRKSLKLKQEAFGSSLGLSQAGYSDIERGKNNISGKVKILLKKEHNINLNWLEKGQGEMFIANIEDDEFDPEKFSEEKDLIEKFKAENDKLKKEVFRLTSENQLYLELVKSKDKIIESLEARIGKK